MSLICTGNALSLLKLPDQELDQVGGGVMRRPHGNANSHVVPCSEYTKGGFSKMGKVATLFRTTDAKGIDECYCLYIRFNLDLEVKIHISS